MLPHLKLFYHIIHNIPRIKTTNLTLLYQMAETQISIFITEFKLDYDLSEGFIVLIP